MLKWPHPSFRSIMYFASIISLCNVLRPLIILNLLYMRRMVAIDAIVLEWLIRSRITAILILFRELFRCIPWVLVLKTHFCLHLPLLNAAVSFWADVSLDKEALDFLASLGVLTVLFLLCIFTLGWALLDLWFKMLRCCISLRQNLRTRKSLWIRNNSLGFDNSRKINLVWGLRLWLWFSLLFCSFAHF